MKSEDLIGPFEDLSGPWVPGQIVSPYLAVNYATGGYPLRERTIESTVAMVDCIIKRLLNENAIKQDSLSH